MNLADFCAYCLSLPDVEETTPFGPEAIVYKVGGKMFALAMADEVPTRVNLKCDPERALELRDRYEDITPGYHMNKMLGSKRPIVLETLIEEGSNSHGESVIYRQGRIAKGILLHSLQ